MTQIMLVMFCDTGTDTVNTDDADNADGNTCEQPECHQLRRRTSPR